MLTLMNGFCSSDLPSDRSQRLTHGTPSSSLLPLLLPLLLSSFFPSSSPSIELGDGERKKVDAMHITTRGEETLRLLVDLFIAFSAAPRPPALLLLDNCQWLDSASWKLVLLLSRMLLHSRAEQAIPLMMILTTRPPSLNTNTDMAYLDSDVSTRQRYV